MIKALSCDDTFESVITSPLIRCHDFAKSFSDQRHYPLTIDPAWREICFGDWDGEPMAQLYQRYPEQLDQFWKTPWQFTPPNGEPTSAFTHRVDRAWEELIQQHKSTLVVCHSGIIRYLIAKILGMPIPGNNHLVALNIGFAARVDIEIVIEPSGKVWQTLQWPNK